jgi:hypothetical protein
LCFMEPSDYEEITLKDEKEGDNDGNWLDRNAKKSN